VATQYFAYLKVVKFTDILYKTPTREQSITFLRLSTKIVAARISDFCSHKQSRNCWRYLSDIGIV